MNDSVGMHVIESPGNMFEEPTGAPQGESDRVWRLAPTLFEDVVEGRPFDELKDSEGERDAIALTSAKRD